MALGSDGRLVYTPNSRGDTIIDYAHVGYLDNLVELPTVAAQLWLVADASSADDGPRIQAAIDLVASMPLDDSGFRGAV